MEKLNTISKSKIDAVPTEPSLLSRIRNSIYTKLISTLIIGGVVLSSCGDDEAAKAAAEKAKQEQEDARKKAEEEAKKKAAAKKAAETSPNLENVTGTPFKVNFPPIKDPSNGDAKNTEVEQQNKCIADALRNRLKKTLSFRIGNRDQMVRANLQQVVVEENPIRDGKVVTTTWEGVDPRTGRRFTLWISDDIGSAELKNGRATINLTGHGSLDQITTVDIDDDKPTVEDQDPIIVNPL